MRSPPLSLCRHVGRYGRRTGTPACLLSSFNRGPPAWGASVAIASHSPHSNSLRCFTSDSSSSSSSHDKGKSSIVSHFANVDVDALGGGSPHTVKQLMGGQWVDAEDHFTVVDPLNGEEFIKSPNTKVEELEPFIRNVQNVPKSGTHNFFKHPERYLLYGRVCHVASALLHNPEVIDFFAKLIQRTMPKTYAQAYGEMVVVRSFLENFSGDRVRMMCRGFTQPGDRAGQVSSGYRWPYGSVSVISPFNFPLEIPMMQTLGALMVGNRVTLKPESTQTLPVEQFIRFLHFCGLPLTEFDFISCRGDVMSQLINSCQQYMRMTQFTGGMNVAEKLIHECHGRIKIEDAGYDWKLMGEDLPHGEDGMEYAAWQCDQDAFAMSGQKCSAQSLLCLHTNWIKAGFIERLQRLAERRSLSDLSIGPVLSHTNKEIQQHVDALLALPKAKLLFGGSPLTNHSIPSKYGAYQPTAIFVPLTTIIKDIETFRTVTTELFGPLQVVTEWTTSTSSPSQGEEGGEDRASEQRRSKSDLDTVLEIFETIGQHLTAAVVSSNFHFINHVLSHTCNGTTYAGARARTTGAPQNHWFGPAGNPLGAGIGTPEAILQTWTCHREIVTDDGHVPQSWSLPPPT